MVDGDTLLALLQAAIEGDDVAVATFVRRTQPSVWRVCSVLGSPGEVEDLVQETYLRAFGALRTFRGEAPVLAWLLSIARRVCADDVRKRQRIRRLSERMPTRFRSVPAPSEPLDEVLRYLNPEQREAFVLTQLVGLSYEEAAVAMECPIGTVRSRVARARDELARVARAADAV
ncbi:MAG: sigma-70 family RNA polymerase sigma factor [Acidimicrobiia bacterium]